MNITLDLDGVIADIQPEFEIRLKRDFGIDLPLSEWTTIKIVQQFPEVPSEWIKAQLHDPTFFLNARCREDAWHMVNKWFMDGNDVFIVTCRWGEAAVRTERWLDEWEICYNRMYHSETRLKKYNTCLKLQADFLVEDDPHEVKETSKYLPTYLLEHPYNRDYDIGAGIRIASLYELDELVEKSKVQAL